MGKGGYGKASGGVPANGSVGAEVPASEVLIDGKLYDVAGFKHPGGSIVKFLADGGDATEAFKEFHMRSKKAELVLKSLPKRDAPEAVLKERAYNKKEALAKDYAKMRAELEADGFFEPSPAHCVYRVVELIAMHLLGGWLFFTAGESTAQRVLALFVLGIAEGRCGWLMHEGGHYSMSGNIAIDRMLQIVFYGVGCGMSGMWWRNQHNKHHATPQKLQHDVDLDTLPLVAFNSECINSEKMAKRPIMRAWLRAQGFLFVPLSCLLVASGWQFYLHPRHMLKIMTSKRSVKGYPQQAAMELAMLAVRYYLLFGVLFAGFSTSEKFALYNLYNFFGASYIFTNFAMSHTHLPVTKPDEFLHWVEYSSNHTTNLNAHPVTNWWMSYLNFQIEHHLFPSMPQFRHPETSKRVQKLFAKHGLTYDSRPYFSCLFETLANLHQVGHDASKMVKQE